jgi:hypothetical protein
MEDGGWKLTYRALLYLLSSILYSRRLAEGWIAGI